MHIISQLSWTWQAFTASNELFTLITPTGIGAKWPLCLCVSTLCTFRICMIKIVFSVKFVWDEPRWRTLAAHKTPSNAALACLLIPPFRFFALQWPCSSCVFCCRTKRLALCCLCAVVFGASLCSAKLQVRQFAHIVTCLISPLFPFDICVHADVHAESQQSFFDPFIHDSHFSCASSCSL